MKWLWYHAANSWGEDKLRPKERVAWSKDRVSMLCSYANDPYTNQEWLKADKPFSFLACCMEIKAAIDWSSHSPVESFPSCLPVYIDGSNNGVQHLAAISLDEEVAPLVNLVPSDLPGDVYMFIADKVWENLKVMAGKLPEKTSSKFGKLLLEGKVLQLTYERAPANSEQKFLAYSELKTWKNNNRLLREQLFSTYWLGITDKKLIRKSVKRPVMTLG
jgi:DNA-directed RNA polymerase